MKSKIILIISLAFFICLFGCEKKQVSIDIDQLIKELETKLPLSDELSPIKENVIYHLYALDSKDVEEIQVWISSGATAEEIAVIKTNDITSVKEAVEKRVELKRKDFEGYLPKELEKLKDPVIITKGNYVILCITSDPDLARNIINHY